MEKAVDDLYVLPEACIAHIISLTTPRDACRLYSVSPTFASAAQSDTVWRSFPREGYSVHPPRLPPRPKDFSFSLCDQTLLIDKDINVILLFSIGWKKHHCVLIKA
ncbi:F-box domain containing protein [Parasponia andersonii]|uniref:F-box domain containing protein n=1 Tax=Parasponia andersonii TaxID=3476 RepID=A0A2P5DTG5_PARAD|nr:F-box domain containing protein [Parasponia andersonii]